MLLFSMGDSGRGLLGRRERGQGHCAVLANTGYMTDVVDEESGLAKHG